jgi:hypothetical protein
MRIVGDKYILLGVVKGSGGSCVEVVGSVENIDSKPPREFEVICRLYQNKYKWFYIVNESNGVARYSYGISNSLNYIFSN